MDFFPLRNKPPLAGFGKGDYLVLFGELFSRGYANGLVEEAEKRGLTVIRTTVGRRTKEGDLRPLEESEKPEGLFINTPLEAGFDLEPAANGVSPAQQLKDVKLSDWESAQVDFQSVKESQIKGRQRFEKNLDQYVKELSTMIPSGAKVLFAHLMAGGVPRAKIVMPMMNRAVKGTGDRYLASENFWNSPIGQLCALSFNEVTAETFDTLIEKTTALREKVVSSGGHVSYLAYGYHGTEIYLNNEYRFQTYTPYLQGWAKKNLEEISKKWSLKGLNTCVYNCPEILTNSSSIFQGVEVSLYPLLLALKKEVGTNPATERILKDCQNLLKEDASLADVERITQIFFGENEIRAHCDFEKWPQHSSQLQLQMLLEASGKLYELHKDEKNLMTQILSEVVFRSCGYVMFHDSYKPAHPVAWIGHDLVARCLDETW